MLACISNVRLTQSRDASWHYGAHTASNNAITDLRVVRTQLKMAGACGSSVQIYDDGQWQEFIGGVDVSDSGRS